MVRLGACMIAVAAAGAVADPPIPPDPPVHHTNQGRNVDDGPKTGTRHSTNPVIGDISNRGIWIPLGSAGDNDIDRLTLPEFPVGTLGTRVDTGGSITVTPAPSTLGLLALGGLAMSRRRRRD